MKTINKPQRISRQDLANVAASGVQRALQARATCMRELTDQEIEDVSGGATLALKYGPIIAGGIIQQLYSGKLGLPGLETGSLDLGLNGLG